MSLRSVLYGLGRILGDLEAVRKGRIAERLINKQIGKRGVAKVWMKRRGGQRR